MPVLKNSNYNPHQLLYNGHMQTIIPALFREKHLLRFERERINTTDGDFLDLDWLKQESTNLIIISHGLEGNSQRPYMTGMAGIFFDSGYDVLNWNYRGCSGSPNHKPFFYHSGATYDLEEVVCHASGKYKSIYLVGFSLGGNLTLKYLAETNWPCQKNIKKAVAISVPLDLSASCDKIDHFRNKVYAYNFLLSLKKKVRKKALAFPEIISDFPLRSIYTLRAFDDAFTAPLHGFKNAADYYEKNASLYFLEAIKIPCLILNAMNDPFLGKTCYPREIGERSEKIYMEFPNQGGHVGFSPRSKAERYWSESRALEFIQNENYL
ncbi:YheT family hydrolase [Cyclobacterium plantarum]|uniref:Alpha/beta fold hydrolase n=1 Tax=Cyclobacterium plantarum TaxID=2716263 RepID=A0ABX0H5J8_9BACT|nr:alpha/beta fold hydrolase [Cyclobacterium plantarum]NHE55609.1 alpha/beta fold hydrolase [Cyclobacterium plantarum]